MCLEDVIISAKTNWTQRTFAATATPRVALAADPNRQFFVLVGGGGGVAWFGFDSSVGVNNGLQIASTGISASGSAFPNGLAKREWWGVRATADVTVTIFEGFLTTDFAELADEIARLRRGKLQ